MYAQYPDTEPIRKAVALVMSRQLPAQKYLEERDVLSLKCGLPRLVEVLYTRMRYL